MKKLIILSLLAVTLYSCNNRSIIKEVNPKETTLQQIEQAKQAEVYRVVENKNKDIILYDLKSKEQVKRIYNDTGNEKENTVAYTIFLFIFFIGGLKLGMEI